MQNDVNLSLIQIQANATYGRWAVAALGYILLYFNFNHCIRYISPDGSAISVRISIVSQPCALYVDTLKLMHNNAVDERRNYAVVDYGQP